MPDTSLSIEQVLSMLTAAPQRIAALSSDASPARLQTVPAGDEWSPNDVLAHLRACADVWGDCIETIIARDRPTLRAVNPRAWLKQTDYPAQKFRPSLNAYASQRAELLALLQPLSPAGWARQATITGAGKVLERTVLFYAQWMAGHERPHLNQLERMLRVPTRIPAPGGRRRT